MSDTIKANSSNKYEEYYKRKADTSTMTSIRLNESTDTTHIHAHNVRKDTRGFTKISTGRTRICTLYVEGNLNGFECVFYGTIFSCYLTSTQLLTQYPPRDEGITPPLPFFIQEGRSREAYRRNKSENTSAWRLLYLIEQARKLYSAQWLVNFPYSNFMNTWSVLWPQRDSFDALRFPRPSGDHWDVRNLFANKSSHICHIHGHCRIGIPVQPN